MARMLSAEARRRLLEIARSSVEHAVRTGAPLPIELARELPELRTKRATFTTLMLQGNLRGCTGVVLATRPLAQDVASTACSAAIRDTRFSPVSADELGDLDVSVAVLSPMEELRVSSEAELLARIRPGVDGLMLTDGTRRGIFLPQVWESLPEPREFLEQLRRKASLPPGHWSDTLRIDRFDVEKIRAEQPLG